jgi:citrate synthase
LRANVEFYTAVLLSTLGIESHLFTPLFACARSAGWAAHVHEQTRTGRLIRPASRYIGPMPAADGGEK